MSWFDGKIVSEEEIRQVAFETPSALQVGEKAKVWLFNQSSDDAFFIPVIIAGVIIRANHQVTYDLGFPINGTNLYSVVPNFRGYVTAEDEEFPGEFGGLLDMPLDLEFKPELTMVSNNQQVNRVNDDQPPVRRAFTVVPVKDEALSSETI